MPATTTRRTRRRAAGSDALGLLGIAGTVTCTVTMVLPAIGAVGAAGAAGMSGMSGMDDRDTPGLLGLLLDLGPYLLVASVLLVTAGVALRQPVAAVPALAAGGLLYWGMYGQPSYPVMYLSLAIGFLVWIALYLWTRAAWSREGSSSRTGDRVPTAGA